ncbi:MAG: hypothetical protein K6T30_03590 [Alicyclobacillus sp.]|nr:hypothetical protein [Alicyclobacillus sp.]
MQLPLYPMPRHSRLATIVYGPTASPYLRAGSARFVVSVRLREVKSWYLAKMPSDGFRLLGVHSARGGQSAELDFGATRDAGLTVVLNLRSLASKPRDTVIEYTVTDADVPARPKASLVPADVTSVTVAYQPASTSQALPVVHKTFTQQAVVAALVRAVNDLPVDIRSEVYDSNLYQGGAVLRFADTRGRAVDVRVEMSSNRVIVGNTAPLFDIQNHVWILVSKDMGFAPYPPRG